MKSKVLPLRFRKTAFVYCQRRNQRRVGLMISSLCGKRQLTVPAMRWGNWNAWRWRVKSKSRQLLTDGWDRDAASLLTETNPLSVSSKSIRKTIYTSKVGALFIAYCRDSERQRFASKENFSTL